MTSAHCKGKLTVTSMTSPSGSKLRTRDIIATNEGVPARCALQIVDVPSTFHTEPIRLTDPLVIAMLRTLVCDKTLPPSMEAAFLSQPEKEQLHMGLGDRQQAFFNSTIR